MKFRDEPRKTVLRRWLCDTDGCEGEMIAFSSVMTAPVKHRHECNKCGRRAMESNAYPALMHLPAEEPAAAVLPDAWIDWSRVGEQAVARPDASQKEKARR